MRCAPRTAAVWTAGEVVAVPALETELRELETEGHRAIADRIRTAAAWA